MAWLLRLLLGISLINGDLTSPSPQPPSIDDQVTSSLIEDDHGTSIITLGSMMITAAAAPPPPPPPPTPPPPTPQTPTPSTTEVEEELPIMQALTKALNFSDELTYIYDRNSSGNRTSNFELWLDERFGADAIDREALDSLAEELDELSNAWKYAISMNCNLHERAPDSIEIYEDTTLIIPLGGKKILWGWLLVQSFLTSSVYPESIFFITGLDKGKDEATKFKGFYEYIDTHLAPHLAQKIDIKWAVFEGPGNAGVSRALAARSTNTTYVMYHDADDVLGHSAMEMKIQTLRANEDVSQVLGDYSSCESSKEHIESVSAFLERVASDEDRMIDKLLALDDLSRAYCQTSYNVTEKLMFDKEEAVEEVMKSFQYRGIINLKDVTNWPQLRWYKDCNETLRLIEEVETRHTLNDVSLAAEKRAVDWFSKSCGNQDLKPEFVGSCHNGWGAVRTDVYKEMPFVYPYFGEDSMLTFMISHSNHKSVCLKSATGGVYVMYRRPEVKSVKAEIFPEIANE